MNQEIDGDAIARAPLEEIKDMLRQSEPGSSMRESVSAVIRTVAVHLIAGAVPDGMTSKEAVSRGRDMLALLQSSAQ